MSASESHTRFLEGLNALTNLHRISVGGCGCCSSPFLTSLDAGDFPGSYVFDDSDDGIRWITDKQKWLDALRERADDAMRARGYDRQMNMQLGSECRFRFVLNYTDWNTTAYIESVLLVDFEHLPNDNTGATRMHLEAPAIGRYQPQPTAESDARVVIEALAVLKDAGVEFPPNLAVEPRPIPEQEKS